MKIRNILILCMGAMTGLFTNCASGYRAIHPTIVSYTNESVSDSILFSYKYDILWDSGNKKYARKEKKYETKMVAVKVVNNSNHDIVFDRNIMLYTNNKIVKLVDKDSLYQEFRQRAAAYILYLLFTPVHKFSVNFNGPSDIFPFGFILGPLLAGRNMIVAAHANTGFKYEIYKYDMHERVIAAGETAYGLIGIDVNDYLPLTVKVTIVK